MTATPSPRLEKPDRDEMWRLANIFMVAFYGRNDPHRHVSIETVRGIEAVMAELDRNRRPSLAPTASQGTAAKPDKGKLHAIRGLLNANGADRSPEPSWEERKRLYALINAISDIAFGQSAEPERAALRSERAEGEVERGR